MVGFEMCCHVIVVDVIVHPVLVLLATVVGPTTRLESKLFGTLPSTFPCASYVFHLLVPWSKNSCL